MWPSDCGRAQEKSLPNAAMGGAGNNVGVWTAHLSHLHHRDVPDRWICVGGTAIPVGRLDLRGYLYIHVGGHLQPLYGAEGRE